MLSREYPEAVLPDSDRALYFTQPIRKSLSNSPPYQHTQIYYTLQFSLSLSLPASLPLSLPLSTHSLHLTHIYDALHFSPSDESRKSGELVCDSCLRA
jgi:hypothetical protein